MVFTLSEWMVFTLSEGLKEMEDQINIMNLPDEIENRLKDQLYQSTGSGNNNTFNNNTLSTTTLLNSLQ
jgi:hypothetical protein